MFFFVYTVNVGLAVGLPLGLFFGLCFLALVVVYCNAKMKKRNIRTGAATTSPSSGPDVVTSTQNTYFTTSPTAYPTQPHPMQLYPTQFTPARCTTQPQPISKFAQLSSGEAPPSYDAAIAYPPYTASVSHL